MGGRQQKAGRRGGHRGRLRGTPERQQSCTLSLLRRPPFTAPPPLPAPPIPLPPLPAHSYKVLIDGEERKAGSLFEDFEPPFNPPAEIPDPDDKKPDDWVDEAK